MNRWRTSPTIFTIGLSNRGVSELVAVEPVRASSRMKNYHATALYPLARDKGALALAAQFLHAGAYGREVVSSAGSGHIVLGRAGWGGALSHRTRARGRGKGTGQRFSSS